MAGTVAPCALLFILNALSVAGIRTGDASVLDEVTRCSDAVAGSHRRAFGRWFKRKCKCARGTFLVGDDAACGNNGQRYFNAEEVAGKCECTGCPEVRTQSNFDLNAYISKPWFAQEQAVTKYLPKELNNCVTARYSIFAKRKLWGYTINVTNKAVYDDGRQQDAALCAYGTSKTDPAKLAVAPCFLPKNLAGPYWILAYSEAEGYALISGGQPEVWTKEGCRTGDGINNSGLWIFTREAFPAQALVDKVRQLTREMGFDVGVLNKINHQGCKGDPYE